MERVPQDHAVGPLLVVLIELDLAVDLIEADFTVGMNQEVANAVHRPPRDFVMRVLKVLRDLMSVLTDHNQ